MPLTRHEASTLQRSQTAHTCRWRLPQRRAAKRPYCRNMLDAAFVRLGLNPDFPPIPLACGRLLCQRRVVDADGRGG